MAGPPFHSSGNQSPGELGMKQDSRGQIRTSLQVSKLPTERCQSPDNQDHQVPAETRQPSTPTPSGSLRVSSCIWMACIFAMGKDISRNSPCPLPDHASSKSLIKCLTLSRPRGSELHSFLPVCEAQRWTCRLLAVREGSGVLIFWFSSKDKWESVPIGG